MACDTFRCGHPRTPGNSSPNGKSCALCTRIRTIARQVDRQLEYWKRGTPHKTIGQKIVEGLL